MLGVDSTASTTPASAEQRALADRCADVSAKLTTIAEQLSVLRREIDDVLTSTTESE